METIVPIHEQTAHPAAMVVLQSMTSAISTKKYRKGADGGYEKVDAPFTYLSLPVAIQVPTIDVLYKVLSALGNLPTRCVIRGAVLPKVDVSRGIPRRLHPRPSEPATLHEVPRTWVALDIDGFPGSLAELYTEIDKHLPVLSGVSHVVQRSSSFGIKEGLYVRLWYILSHPATGRFWKRETAAFKAAVPLFDAKLFSPIQIHYTASPIFLDGLASPVAERFTIHHDVFDMADLSTRNAEDLLTPSVVEQNADLQDLPSEVNEGDILDLLSRIERTRSTVANSHDLALAFCADLVALGCNKDRAKPALESLIERVSMTGRLAQPNEVDNMWRDMMAKKVNKTLRFTDKPLSQVFPDGTVTDPQAAPLVVEQQQNIIEASHDGEYSGDAHANADLYRSTMLGYICWNNTDYELTPQGYWNAFYSNDILPLRISRDTLMTQRIVNATAFALRGKGLNEKLDPPCSISTGKRLDDIVMFKNGYMRRDDLMHGETPLYKHNPDHFALSALNVNYNPSAQCPLFENYICDLFPGDQESQTQILRLMAYLLTSDTQFQKFFMLVGPPGSGKSTLMRVIDSILGDNNVTSCSSMESLIDGFGLQPLVGKSVCYFPEANHIGGGSKNGRLVANYIKMITGGDRVNIDRKFLGQLSIRLTSRLIAVCNTPPPLGDESGALARRLVLYKFPRSFTAIEDRQLPEKLCAEKEGIVNLLLRQFAGLYGKSAADGLFTPEAGRVDLEIALRNASPIATFLTDCLEQSSAERVLSSDISDVAQRWFAENNAPVASTQAILAVAYRQFNAVPTKTNGIRYIKGVKFTAEGQRLLSTSA